MLDRLLGRRRPATNAVHAAPPARRDGGWKPNTELGFERLIFFSDAVFAIAITLLALEIWLPDLPTSIAAAQLGAELAKLTPKYVSFLISFLAIGSCWIGHHRRFEYINRYDRRLIWINLLVLAGVAFLPFPNSKLAVQIYAGTMAATGFAVYLTHGGTRFTTTGWWTPICRRR